MFVVLVLQKYNFEITNFPLPVVMDKSFKSIGCLPVYETKEDAKNDYPEMQIAEIKFKKLRNKEV